MSVPDEALNKSFSKDEAGETIFIDCCECSEYQSKVDVTDFEEPRQAFNQAKRQFGSHWSAKHQDEGQGGSTSETSGGTSQGGGSEQPSGQQSPQQSQQRESHQQVNERELIYQKGREGLKQIKKQRLKNWLDNSEGVGPQTENRILMVFERNESVHTNPHVLYNLLEDELTASGSYINTMVEDVFAPEREHEDILSNQGYTPWFRRNNMSGRGGKRQGYSESMGGSMGGQRGFMDGQSRGQGGQTGGGESGISRREAEEITRRTIQEANEQGRRNALLTGLSDATDEAVREMASNVGGLAGTVQRVVDEALVEYARQNPEWVIENMGILQKILGAANETEEGGEEQDRKAEQDAIVDKALEDISGEGTSNERPQNSSPRPQGGFTPSQETREAMEEKSQEEVEDYDEKGVQEPDEESKDPEMDDNVKKGPPEPAPQPQGGSEDRSQNDKEQMDEERDENEEEEDGDPMDRVFGDMME